MVGRIRRVEVCLLFAFHGEGLLEDFHNLDVDYRGERAFMVLSQALLEE